MSDLANMLNDIRNKSIQKEPTNEGGYLIPEYWEVNKSGISARLRRLLGKLLHNDRLYHSGCETKSFIDIMKQYGQLSTTTWIANPKAVDKLRKTTRRARVYRQRNK